MGPGRRQSRGSTANCGPQNTRIVYDHRAPAAEEAAEDYLRPKLERIAEHHDVWLQAAFHAPRWKGGHKPTAAWDAIVELAEKAASNGQLVSDGLGNSVSVRPRKPFVTFCFFASENACLLASAKVHSGLPWALNCQDNFAWPRRTVLDHAFSRQDAGAPSRSRDDVDTGRRHPQDGGPHDT
jgi:hypothetical protein